MSDWHAGFGKLVAFLGDVQANPVLRERVALATEQAHQLKSTIEDLQKEKAELEAENTRLRERIQVLSIPDEFVEHRGALFKKKASGEYHFAVYCPRCRTSSSAFPPGGQFSCNCGWFSSFEESVLDRILREIPS